jgi:NAD-specific glutamate dehydrogenase
MKDTDEEKLKLPARTKQLVENLVTASSNEQKGELQDVLHALLLNELLQERPVCTNRFESTIQRFVAMVSVQSSQQFLPLDQLSSFLASLVYCCRSVALMELNRREK